MESKRRAKEKMKTDWHAWWEALPQWERGKNYSAPHKSKTDITFMLPRPAVAAITGFRTGHGYFKSYLHKFVPAKYLDNKCRCRLRPPQTVQHLILRCPLLTEERERDVGFRFV